MAEHTVATITRLVVLTVIVAAERFFRGRGTVNKKSMKQKWTMKYEDACIQ